MDLNKNRLFRLILHENGEDRELGPEAFEARLAEGRGAAPAEGIEVEIAWCDAGKVSEGTISVTNSGAAEVRRVQFPCVDTPPISTDQHLLVASSFGDDIRNPHAALERFCRCRRRPPPKGLTFVASTEDEAIWRYPGAMAMQFMVLYSGTDSLYVACHGTDDSTVEFRAKRLPETCLRLSVTHLPFLREGSWQSPPVSLGELGPGWHEAADCYAERVQSMYAKPELPEWMNNFHGWVQTWGRREGEPANVRFTDLVKEFERAREYGLDVLHYPGWSGKGFDTLYPDYPIDPGVGTAEELGAAMDTIREKGGRAILYANGRLVDPDSSFAKKGGAAKVCLQEDGTPYSENWGTSVNFNVACQACPEYAEHFTAEFEGIMKECRPHGLQIDQVGASHPFLCFDDNHSHPTPATNFLEGYDRLLKSVRDTARRHDPDFFVWVEGMNERFAQYYDVGLSHGEGPGSWGWQLGRHKPELYRFVHPDHLIVGYCTTFDALCHSFIQGDPLFLQMERLDSDEEYRELSRQLLQLRRDMPQYFLRGVFRADTGLAAFDNARIFRIRSGDDPSRCLLTVNQPGATLQTDCGARVVFDFPVETVTNSYPTAIETRVTGELLDLSWRGPVALLEIRGS